MIKLDFKTSSYKSSIYFSSDWHEEPERMSEQTINWLNRGMRDNALLIGVGDLIDMLPLGREAFEDCKTIDQLRSILDGYPFIWVTGNHDPCQWVEHLLRPSTDNIRVVKSIDAVRFGRKIHIEHGHLWSVDWPMLRHFAPGLVNFMVEHFPRAWHHLCLKAGWLPGEERAKGNFLRYNTLTGLVWQNAIQYAQENSCLTVFGHTHTEMVLRRMGEDLSQAVAADCGSLKQGTYLKLDRASLSLRSL